MNVILNEQQRCYALFAVKHTISMLELMNTASVGYPANWDAQTYHKQMTALWNLYDHLKEAE